jgi:hypothetical protein
MGSDIVETLRKATEELKADGIPASLEYPGFIRASHNTVTLVGGCVNPTFCVNVCDFDDNVIDNFDFGDVPSDTADAGMFANAFRRAWDEITFREEAEAHTVYGFFTQQLGQQPSDATLRDLLVDTPCGEDCRKAILAAKAFKDVADRAVHDLIVRAAEETVEVFWRG